MGIRLPNEINGTDSRRVWHEFEFEFETIQQLGDTLRSTYSKLLKMVTVMRIWWNPLGNVYGKLRGTVGWMQSEKPMEDATVVPPKKEPGI